MVTTYSEAIRANTEGSERRRGAYSTGFSDFVAMKVLAAKRVDRFGSPHGANANVLGFTQRKELVRNLGIRIDAIRLAEIDALTEILGCNKQEFVLEVLVAGIEQAKEALYTAGLQTAYEEKLDLNIQEAGFSVEPSRNEGYWTLHYKGEPLIAGALEPRQPPANNAEMAMSAVHAEPT